MYGYIHINAYTVKKTNCIQMKVFFSSIKPEIATFKWCKIYPFLMVVLIESFNQHLINNEISEF